MKLYVLPPSPRAFKVIALKNYLALDCEMQLVDLGKGDQLAPEYIAMNPNRKMPVLEDDGFVLWESNAILLYLPRRSRRAVCGRRTRSDRRTCCAGWHGKVLIGTPKRAVP